MDYADDRRAYDERDDYVIPDASQLCYPCAERIRTEQWNPKGWTWFELGHWAPSSEMQGGEVDPVHDICATCGRFAWSHDHGRMITYTPDRLARVVELVEAQKALGPEIDKAVEVARQQGASWSQVATALGISKQAAHKRYTSP